jgi:ubiquinone/menaquinone biosynthesis C-methylase UbiE
MGARVMNLADRIPEPVHAAAYKAQQRTMLYSGIAGHQLLRMALRKRIKPNRQAQREVERRYEELLERDLENVRAGLYPRRLLFQFPFLGYARRAPQLARDLPRVFRRMTRQDHQDFPEGVDLRRFPDYFRRNFHWQTDGYFSRHSAEIYDVGVEFLFLGTADVMRRQVIPPISRMVQRRGDDLRVLDVGCGTGRTLHQLALTHPNLHLFGLDLSPYYLRHAREVLDHVTYLSLVADKAEAMPFRDESFDVVTSVYLFHELPKPVRHQVYAEMYRVLRPGGLLVIQDSAQLSDGPGLAYFLAQFSHEFHEPFHAGYLRDDIAAGLCACGFEVDATEGHFVAKVVIATKRPQG